jgi:PKD repeat protein
MAINKSILGVMTSIAILLSVALTYANQLPVAAFTGQTSAITLTANFDAHSSYDPDGTIVSYNWNFGDGETGSGITASHTYAASGTYTVTLTVEDNLGATDTEVKSVGCCGGGPF